MYFVDTFVNALPIFQLEQAGYQVRDKHLLQDASWTLFPGQHTAVLGRNGSGKTTLLRLACGFLWAMSGRVLRLGAEDTDLGELRKAIGWVGTDLAEQIPCGDEVRLVVAAGSVGQVGFKNLHCFQPAADDLADADQALHDVGAGELAGRRFGTLSQGERQKVVIARARMARPLLLVLDEPCAGLDPGARESLLDSLQQLALADNAPTIVLITHHVEEVLPIFVETLVVDHGKILTRGPTEQIINRQLLSSVYDRDVSSLECERGRFWVRW